MAFVSAINTGLETATDVSTKSQGIKPYGISSKNSSMWIASRLGSSVTECLWQFEPVKTASIIEYARQCLDLLTVGYEIDNEQEVAFHLSRNQFLAPFLFELFSDIREYFTVIDKPVLVVTSNYDDDDERKLLILIPTGQDAPAALKELKTFDYNYWSNVDQKIQNEILVDVEFV